MKKSGASQGQSASELISQRIADLGDWRGETLSRMRKHIKEADPDVVEVCRKGPKPSLRRRAPGVSRIASRIPDRRVHDPFRAEGTLALPLERPRHFLRFRG